MTAGTRAAAVMALISDLTLMLAMQQKIIATTRTAWREAAPLVPAPRPSWGAQARQLLLETLINIEQPERDWERIFVN